MKWIRNTIGVSLLALAVGAVDAQEELSVRLQLRDRRVLAGQLTGRVDGHVLFRQADEAPVRIADADIQQIQFRVSSEENARIARFYDARSFRDIVGPLERMLLPLRPYLGLPSNQTENFLRWMVAAYWTGDHERTLDLARGLQRFPDPFRQAANYYRVLAQAKMGRMEQVAEFMATAQADSLFEQGSPARMYLDVRLLHHEGKKMEALRLAAAAIARHSRSTEWMPHFELLCAQLYFELGRMDSAQGVLDDIAEFYDDPMIQEQAAMLAAKHNQTERGQ